MSETEVFRISKVVKEVGVGMDHIKEFLSKLGLSDINPNSKIGIGEYHALLKEFANDKYVAEQAKSLQVEKLREQEQLKLAQAVEEPIVQEEPKKVVLVEEESAQQEILIKDTAVKIEKKEVETKTTAAEEITGPTVLGKIDLSALNSKTKPSKKTEKEKAKEAEDKKANATKTKSIEEKKPEEQIKVVVPIVKKATKQAEEIKPEEPKEIFHETQYQKLSGPTVLGKIELPVKDDKRKADSKAAADAEKQKRKRIKKSVNPNEASSQQQSTGGGPRPFNNNNSNNNRRFDKRAPRGPEAPKVEISEEEIQRQIKETLARLSGSGKSNASKYRREKRAEIRERIAEEQEEAALQSKVLRVTEFVPANELAQLMDVPVNKIIGSCMSIGLFISINQRLDAETIQLVAGEFGFTVEFAKAEETVTVNEQEDNEENLIERAPIVTVMGHVDHGKTSLLDYVRSANVIAGEAGGITQHIGAYNVELKNGKQITFLDTPGHEAFTAMRARGARVTDIVIVVIAADDSVMPQTREAINHAQAAGVPIVFAFNKIDKPGANSDKIREELSAMNILVEDWGGKYQSQEISAKKGLGIDTLLEKVLLEAEILNVKANPNKKAQGTVIESTLDKGKGYVARLLVQAGTLKVGDIILAGSYSGRVKALTDERGKAMLNAGPSIPVEVLGISGSPQAGDLFKIMDDERDAREIAAKRLQLQREQGYRAQKHITLDEIGRRLAIGDFKQLNIIIKGDVDGSVEALTDSLLKLTTERIAVNVVMKAVGAVSESDVLLASASDAIIVAFNVRPSVNARKLAETEQIQIKTYSIIYAAIDEIKAAMEGMLAPQFEERVTANIEIREVFSISKVGKIAGCMVLDGKVDRKNKIRIVRDGIVVYNGELGSLKRHKDDVKEVAKGFECGLNIDKFNDIKEGDIIEAYETVEVKAKL